MSVMIATRRTATDVLGAVSATTQIVSNGATALADLSAAGALHAAHYRKNTETELSLSSDEFEAIARDRARMRLARAKLSLNSELSADAELQAIYDSISFDDQAPALSVAAE